MKPALPRARRTGSTILLAVSFLIAAPATAGEPVQLFFVIENQQDTAPACFAEGENVNVRVRLGPSESLINGAQFLVEYDPACLDFVDIAPAGDPYTLELVTIADEAAGTVFYAIGVEFDGEGHRGDADLAVLTFEKSASCDDCVLCFGGENPFDTFLTDDVGQPVPVLTTCSEPIHAAAGLSLTLPPDVETEVGCGRMHANVSWPPPTATAACGDLTLSCSGEHESGYMFDADIAHSGGRVPRGLSTFCCTAFGTCNNVSEDCWTVTVRDPASFLHAQPDPAGVDKSRFLSLHVDTEGRRAAIRVTMNRVYDEQRCPPRGPDLPDLSAFDGQPRWVGPPFAVSETSGEEPPTFIAAQLRCCPYYADWNALLDGKLLNIFGPEVVPCSAYVAQLIPECCTDNPGDPACNAAELTVATAEWGDVIEPIADGRQPTFRDIAAGVDKFKAVPFDPGPPPTGGPSKTRTLLYGNTPDPHRKIGFLDIGMIVDAFKTLPYREPGPTPCTDPCP